jgi:uncharacterized membrane protein YgcG
MELNGMLYVSGVPILITEDTQLPSQLVEVGSSVLVLGHTIDQGIVEVEKLELLPPGTIVPAGTPVEVESDLNDDNNSNQEGNLEDGSNENGIDDNSNSGDGLDVNENEENGNGESGNENASNDNSSGNSNSGGGREGGGDDDSGGGGDDDDDDD